MTEVTVEGKGRVVVSQESKEILTKLSRGISIQLRSTIERGYNCPVSRTISMFLMSLTVMMIIFVAVIENIGIMEGLEGNEGQIEIHFVDEAIPGYFWLFP